MCFRNVPLNEFNLVRLNNWISGFQRAANSPLYFFVITSQSEDLPTFVEPALGAGPVGKFGRAALRTKGKMQSLEPVRLVFSAASCSAQFSGWQGAHLRPLSPEMPRAVRLLPARVYLEVLFLGPAIMIVFVSINTAAGAHAHALRIAQQLGGKVQNEMLSENLSQVKNAAAVHE